MTADFQHLCRYPGWNQLGDSRAERENDVQDLRMRVVSMEEPSRGFFGRRWLPLNDSRFGEARAERENDVQDFESACR